MSLPESLVPDELLVTAGEFEAGYAAVVGATVEGLHAKGRVAERCSCDWDRCLGWVLGYRLSSLVSDRELFGLPE